MSPPEATPSSREASNNKLGNGPIHVRKSTRLLGKSRNVTGGADVSTTRRKIKGPAKNRPLPKKVIKAPYACSIPITCDHVFFRDTYFQIGDIVGLRDATDGLMYYAQIRGFLNDQYCEKSAIITWLLPSAESPDEGFDPSTYFLGPEEDMPRKLEHMQFVCHAPSEYYRNPNAPLPTATLKAETGFIWTRLDKQEPGGVAFKLKECKKVASRPRFVADNDEDGQSNNSNNPDHIKMEDIQIAEGRSALTCLLSSSANQPFDDDDGE